MIENQKKKECPFTSSIIYKKNYQTTRGIVTISKVYEYIEGTIIQYNL